MVQSHDGVGHSRDHSEAHSAGGGGQVEAGEAGGAEEGGGGGEKDDRDDLPEDGDAHGEGEDGEAELVGPPQAQHPGHVLLGREGRQDMDTGDNCTSILQEWPNITII